ncbi:MAG: class I SAM-dependent methyltransferase [Actinobacteria bacterium]|nr:class I SAM-dependent methyltransferase [Actinomycetota bacterium]
MNGIDPSGRGPIALAVSLAAVRPGETVLDLSGRAGNMALHVAAAAGSVETVQSEPELAEEGRRLAAAMGHDNVFFSTASLDDLPFDAGQFDVVLLCLGLAREPRPLAALAEVRRVLRPTGRVVLQEILAFSEPALDLRLWEAERLLSPRHLLFYSLEELHALADGAGLGVDAEETSDLTQDFAYWAGSGGAAGGSRAAEANDARVQACRRMFLSLGPRFQQRLDLALADGRISFTYPLGTLLATAR